MPTPRLARTLTGTPEAPVKTGIPIADISAGMYAYSGILAALYERERTGTGDTTQQPGQPGPDGQAPPPPPGQQPGQAPPPPPQQ